MSTADPINPGLHAVPTPPQKERFALLLHLRRAAREAFDTLLALPRGAAGWVLARTRTVLSAIGKSDVLARMATGVASIGDLIRSVGPVTAAAAVLSIPAVWRATLRVGRWLGSHIVAGAKALWQQTRSLLGKCGPTGTRIAAGLANTGTAVQQVVVALVAHPVTHALVEGIRSLAVLVRPVSQSTVVHRLLGRLVGPSWLRWSLELLLLPVVLLPDVLTDSTAQRRAPRTPFPSAATPSAKDLAPNVPAVRTPASDEGWDAAGSSGSHAWGEGVEPRNRAERRAAQQAQIHAKRARARR